MARKKFDYVIGLISGRFESVKIGDKFYQEFVPMVENKHPTLHRVLANSDLSRQQVLEKERLINPSLIINRDEFSKSEVEKKSLKIAKQQANAIIKRTRKVFQTFDFELWKYLALKANKVNHSR